MKKLKVIKIERLLRNWSSLYDKAKLAWNPHCDLLEEVKDISENCLDATLAEKSLKNSVDSTAIQFHLAIFLKSTTLMVSRLNMSANGQLFEHALIKVNVSFEGGAGVMLDIDQALIHCYLFNLL